MTATDVLDLHANVLPIELLLHRICHRAAIRLVTLPASHPLALVFRMQAKRFIKSHHSPLHKLAFIFNISPDSVETLSPARSPPRQQSRFEIAPDSTAAESIEWDISNTADIRIYTDGLGLDGQAGAAAVLYRGDQAPKVLRLHLGTLLEHMTFEAEAVGLILGAFLLSEEGQVSSATISTDSQTALLSLDIHKPRPGQQYIDEFLCLTRLIWRQAMQDEYHLTLAWVKGHNRVDGNARANEEARDAAKGSSSPEMELPESLHAGPLPTSVAAL